MRYLIGATLLGTGGSLLAAGILHASVNASGQLAAVSSWWPGTVAMPLLAVLVAVRRHAKFDDLGYASEGSVSTLTR
jgi:hypothetical protein